MKLLEATAILNNTKRAFFARRDLVRLFREPRETAAKTIKRLCEARVLDRVAQGVYQFRYAASPPSASPLYYLASIIRRGEFVFEALESAAAQWSLISQIPLGRLTLMTTGRSGLFETAYGVIEFVHTSAPLQEIRANVIERDGNPIPLATKAYTRLTLQRTHRSSTLLKEADSHALEH